MAIRRLLHHSQSFFWQRNFQRKDFARLEDSDVEHFRSILSPKAIVQDPDRIEHHNICWRRVDKGESQLLLCPHSTEEVSKILRHCN